MLTYDSGLKHISYRLINSLGIKVTKGAFFAELEENPFYPSLLSLTDTFERFSVPSEAFKVPKDELLNLEAPFISFVTIPNFGTDFVLVESINQSKVKYLHGNNIVAESDTETFRSRFNEIVVIAAKSDESGDYEYARKKRIERKKMVKKTVAITCISMILLAVILSSIPTTSFYSFALLGLIKVAGVVVSSLLIAYEFSDNSSFLANLCTVGKRNCKAVISSRASKFMGVSWSEFGLLYFISTLILINVSVFTELNKVFILGIVSSISSFYIVYSLYYQWRVIKQWCPLCLVVQLILLFELIWSISNFWVEPFVAEISLIPIIEWFAIGVLMPASIWVFLKPLLLDSRKGVMVSKAFKRLTNNSDVFQVILKQQSKAPSGWQTLGIDIGNEDAPNTILKICNPFCGPCSKAHPLLEDIIDRNENVKLKIIFYVPNRPGDPSATVVKHLLSLPKDKVREALDYWYLKSNRNYEHFSLRFPPGLDINDLGHNLDLMVKWCEDAEIRGTPTIFLNGYKLPDYYSLDKLKGMSF